MEFLELLILKKLRKGRFRGLSFSKCILYKLASEYFGHQD